MAPSRVSVQPLYAPYHRTNSTLQVGGQLKSVSGSLQSAVGTLVRAHGFAGRGRDRYVFCL
jgi:hypothetical protein